MEEILEDQIRITALIEPNSHLQSLKDADCPTRNSTRAPFRSNAVTISTIQELEDDAEAAELNVMMVGLGDSSSETSDQPSEEDWRAWGLWEDESDEPSQNNEGDNISYTSDGPPDLQEMSDSSADSAEYSSGIDDLFWNEGDEGVLEDDSDEENESRYVPRFHPDFAPNLESDHDQYSSDEESVAVATRCRTRYIRPKSYRATVEDYVSDENETDRSEITLYDSDFEEPEPDSDEDSSSTPMLAESYGVRLEIEPNYKLTRTAARRKDFGEWEEGPS
ncbi:hypothetical protein SISSUDRAFT_1068252 [Sistotremastrum suecicum HHB10207 ss-3]|uniref:Uncharacterized protein n=1 Tax=Sistotremastrum suecicum HHB10207 ss-3 TaxID=1314776 RepID=A0A165WD18_9AGAM|nr:hypothetical protein SISSUDRAFT_1068252 [Sistotremastrum suecicum HHB10207 ss-3]